MLSIIQALATLIAGFTVGLIFIWKLGLVGFGKSTIRVNPPLVILIASYSMRSFPYVRWLHSSC